MRRSPSHEGQSWPYHEKTNGDMVPCASNPCRLHGGGDIDASSLEEAYRIRDSIRTNAATASSAAQNKKATPAQRKASLKALKALKQQVKARHGKPLPIPPVDAHGNILDRPPLPVTAIHGGEDGGMPVYEVSSAYAEEYSKMLTDVFHSGEDGGQVSEETPESMASMRMFVSPDGMAGTALAADDVTGEGNPPDYVTAVCKRKGCSWEHTGARMVGVAASQGGKRLDCFNTFLPKIYRKAGFCMVGRMTFDDQYAPETWDYDAMDEYNHGRPDVVFMVAMPQDTREKYHDDGEKADVWDRSVPEFDDYDKAQLHAKSMSGRTDEWAEAYFRKKKLSGKGK